MASSLVQFSGNLADAVEHAGASVVAVPEGGREGVVTASPLPQRTLFAAATRSPRRGHSSPSHWRKVTAKVAGLDHGNRSRRRHIARREDFRHGISPPRAR